MSIRPLINRLKLFGAETRGSVAVEFVIMMPILFWAFMATYVFFDGYRQSAVNLKAAYTISDLISRETEILNDEYIDSMYSLMQILTRTSSSLSLRITVIRWDEADDRYYVDWSTNRQYGSNLTNATIGNIESQLPVMPDNERVILVETINTFVPALNVGMDDRQLENFVFTRPRFAPQLCAAGSSFVILDTNCQQS
jgi:Flp pilus assembly protein TadG